MASCRAGSAIAVERAFPILEIREKNRYKTWFDIDFEDLPLEVKIWRLPYGYHSICTIGYVKECEAVRVLNFPYETTTEGWIFLQNLYHFVNDGNSGWVARSFEPASSQSRKNDNLRLHKEL